MWTLIHPHTHARKTATHRQEQTKNRNLLSFRQMNGSEMAGDDTNGAEDNDHQPEKSLPLSLEGTLDGHNDSIKVIHRGQS